LHFPMSSKQLKKLAPLMSKYRVRCIGSGALMGAYVATGYLTGVIDYRVKVWDIAAAYALCESVGLKWVFTEISPFPLKQFHPQMDFSPYLAGTESFFHEIRRP
jgi:myo-inositol-1(or 4)-monophosphatase